MPHDPLAAQAVLLARGERTTLGVVGAFYCGCCRRRLPAEQSTGGVWTSDHRHLLICRECSELYDPPAA